MELINKKYKLIDKIGSGTFGTIYKAQNIRTNEYVAIKMEAIESQIKLLKNESIVYQYLNGCEGIPNVKWFGKDGSHYYMVLNLLGISLHDLKNKLHKFSLTLGLKTGVKILLLLQTIHNKGLVHRDIKPDNFLFGVNSYNDIYLIDFGFCKTFLKDETHIPMNTTHNIIGSYNYASIMSHNRCELSRRDDLESLGYMLMYLVIGELPWNNETDERVIIQKKMDISNNDNYPKILRDFITYVRLMRYEEKPNYYLIIENFKSEIELLSKTN